MDTDTYTDSSVPLVVLQVSINAWLVAAWAKSFSASVLHSSMPTTLVAHGMIEEYQAQFM
jgi:hypothetical protein